MKKVFMILGMHRSGTSMVTQLCQYMGAYLGEENELIMAAETNPDGHFENSEISRIDNDILHYCGQEWYNLGELEVDYSSLKIISAMNELRHNIQKLLSKSDTVAIKDPRISLLLPLWEKVLDGLDVELYYIWVYRNPLEVAESLKKRNGYSRKHSLLLWIYYNLGILKFLKGKEYLQLHYKNILESFQGVEELSNLLGKEYNEDLKWNLERLVKRRYRHSNYSLQNVKEIHSELLFDLYSALLNNQESEADIFEWEKKYRLEKADERIRYIDYEVLENVKCLQEKEIIIYGAGNYGRQAADMLLQLGLLQFDFCDKDSGKHGIQLKGGTVLSIEELEERKNLCVIIAIEREVLREEVEQTLRYLKGISFLSFCVLRMAWKYAMEDISLTSKIERFSLWYNELAMRCNLIKEACNTSVLVYQNKQAISSMIIESLQVADIENVYIHKFFFKKDIVGELLLGDGEKNFIKSFNIFQFQSSEYIKCIKNEIKGKKIITVVQEPISVDLSTIFQWVETGIADRYVARGLKQGKSFQQIIIEIMWKVQDHLFDWFDEELKELTGIDVFEHPFDKEKGYAIISENGVKLLLMKAEKLSNMTKVVREFTGNNQVELVNQNLGREKGYAHIYEAVKEKLEIPRKYVEHYYKDNLYMDHFYTEEEKKGFWMKWAGSIKKN